MRAPAWARVLLALDRAVDRARSIEQAARDAALVRIVPRSAWSALTVGLYEGQASYAPGGNRYRSGLFPWETRLFATPPFPARGRLLLGGAGGGRELVALRELGHDVVAFEPCAPLVARAGDASGMIVAAYDDLVDAVACGTGPLARLVDGPPFDGIVLGWGSLSHVVDAPDRRRLFASLRRAWPDAVVATSFLARPHGETRSVRISAAAGAVATLSRGDIDALAVAGGYDVAVYDTHPYGHALLVPSARPAQALDGAHHERVDTAAPSLARTILALDRVASRLQGGAHAVIGEAIGAFATPDARAAIAAAARMAEDGRELSTWERAVLRLPEFPSSGRLLVWGAGRGREVVALERRGFGVVALDAAPTGAAAHAVRADYADLVRFARDRRGPLAAILGTRFDVILVADGVLEATPPDDRATLFDTLRKVAPDAKVLASVSRRDENVDPRSRRGRLRRALAAATRHGGAAFSTAAGFIYPLEMREIEAAAARAGYAIAWRDIGGEGVMWRPAGRA